MTLELVPINELIRELQTRCEESIFASTRTEDPGNPIINVYWDGNNLKCIGLCEHVKEAIIVKDRKDFTGETK